MSKRTMFLVAFGTVLSALAGAVAALLVIVMLNPGVKGPHVTGDQMNAAFWIGGFLGGGSFVMGRKWWSGRRRA